MSRYIKQIDFETPFPLYNKTRDTKDRWVSGVSNPGAKKKGPKGEMIDAPDEVTEDSIGLVFTVYDKNGEKFIRRCPWARVLMVEYGEE